MQCRRCLAMRILSVCPSVRVFVLLSVKRVICDKIEEWSVQIFVPYERSLSLVFGEEWLVGVSPSTWNFWLTGCRWSKIADFHQIFVRSPSAVTPSEKNPVKANRKSTTLFPMRIRWSLYVAPKSPEGVSKTQNGWDSCKIALRLKKVCYQVSLCENCQRQSCKAFIGLSYCAKIIGGGRPLVPEILDQSDRVAAKSPIFDLFSFVAPQP